MKKNFWLKGEQIRQLLPHHGGCIATDRIVVDGKLVGFMYREPPDNEVDTGWRFLAGDESDAYMEDAKNHGAYALNTLANHDTAILPFLDAPYGSAFRRDWETYQFVEDETWETDA